MADLRDFLGQPTKHRFAFAALALVLTLGLMLAVWKQFDKKPEWRPPEIIYVKQWSASRTRAEIQAQQARDLPGELAEKRALEQAQAERRAQFKRVADMMGVNTERK